MEGMGGIWRERSKYLSNSGAGFVGDNCVRSDDNVEI
jgi:hypothetical protein